MSAHQTLQRSNYVIGKGGCATVYLGRIVERAPCSADASPAAARSENGATPDGGRARSAHTHHHHHHHHHRPLDLSPGVSSVTSSEAMHGGMISDGHCTAFGQHVAVKKKFVSGNRYGHHGHGASPSPKPKSGPSSLEPEHELMDRLEPHPNVMRVLACCSVGGAVHFAMPLMDSDIGHELKKRGASFSEHEALLLTRDLLRGLAHVHAQGIAHRDVKPSNVLLVRDDDALCGVRAVLSDFGVAHRIDPETAQHASKGCGTLWYQPPEQLLVRFDTCDAQRCDVWAVGCILYEMLTSRAVFQSGTACGALGLIRDAMGSLDAEGCMGDKAPILATLPTDVSDATKELLGQLLRVDPAARITADHALDSPAFAMCAERSEHPEAPMPAATPSITLHGYSPLPNHDGLRFEDLTNVALDFSDMTLGNASTCHRSEQRSRVFAGGACSSGGAGGGLFGSAMDDSGHSLFGNVVTNERTVRTIEDRVALAGNRAVPIADGRNVTLGNATVNAQFWENRREHSGKSPRSGSTYARPSDGASTSGSARRPTMPARQGSLISLQDDCSPIHADVSPQRRTLNFDSDDDDDSPVFPQTGKRMRDPMAETARPISFDHVPAVSAAAPA